MRSAKKPRLADADTKENETRGDALDSTTDHFRQTTAFYLRLLSMLQEHSDVDPLALLGDSNFAPAHLRDELMHKRKHALKLHTIPGDCSNSVIEFLHVPEACLLQRTNRGFREMVKRALRCTRARAVSYRGRDVDGHVIDWLVQVYRVCPTFKLAKSCSYWDSVSDLWDLTLHYGCGTERRGHVERIPQLDSRAVYALLDNTDVDPNIIRSYASGNALWYASYGNDVELVRRLLTYPNIDVNSRYRAPIYMHGTIRNGEPEDMGTTRRNGAPGARGTTPLIAAAMLGHKGVLSLLLADPRCDVNLRAIRVDYNTWSRMHKSNEKTVLYFSADIGVLEVLLASPRVDPNMRSADGRTALCDAAADHKEYAVRALVACDRVDVNARDPKTSARDTPLHLLCGFCSDDGGQELCDLLLRHNDIDKNARNDYGESILMTAAFRGDVYMVRSLLADEEVVVDCVDNYGNTALHHAVNKMAPFKKMAMCIDAFRDSGRFDGKINLRNQFSQTALHVLLRGKHRPREAFEALLQFTDIDVNAQLDIEDYNGYLDTPLHRAVRHGYPDYVELLLGVPGIDLSVQDAEKYTPVALACNFACSLREQVEFRSETRVFELLLNAPAPDCDLYARNSRMLRYVASMALYFGETSALEMLLGTPRPGIDTRAKSSHGAGSMSKRETALQYALRMNPSCPRKTRKKVISIFRKARREGYLILGVRRES